MFRPSGAHRLSTRNATSATGTTVTGHDYFAFGESTSPLGGDPRRYLGQERDAETALDQFGARDYRNVWGRFLSVDPIFSVGARANPQLWNRYAYGLNGPLRYVDPGGLEPGEPEPIAADYGGTGAITADDWWEFYTNASIDHSYTMWLAHDRLSVAAEEQQAIREARERLVAAQDKAMAEHTASRGQTYCNRGLWDIMKATGHPLLWTIRGPQGWVVTANEMSGPNGIMARSPLWHAVSPYDAQRLANAGQVVVGTYFNPSGHGHVVTVRPGGTRAGDPLLAHVGAPPNGERYASSSSVPLVYYTYATSQFYVSFR